jgi:hypothetical protein
VCKLSERLYKRMSENASESVGVSKHVWGRKRESVCIQSEALHK